MRNRTERADDAAPITPLALIDCEEDELIIDNECMHPDYFNLIDAHRFYNYYTIMHPDYR